MRSVPHGKSTSDVEVTNVGRHGFWLLIDDRELFLPYDQFPWFRDATVSQIVKIHRLGPEHLQWPDLDVDLTLDSIEHPERYPLVSKARRKRLVRRTATPAKPLAKAKGSAMGVREKNVRYGGKARKRRTGRL